MRAFRDAVRSAARAVAQVPPTYGASAGMVGKRHHTRERKVANTGDCSA